MIYGLRVFALGGGTGLSSLLRGLKRFVDPPASEPGARGDSVYFADLAAMVTVTDDGGSSGRLRDEFQMLAPGDIRNCLVALSADESLLSSLFQYRFEGGGGLHGHNFGNLFLTALTSVTGDFAEAVRMASHVLAIRGRIFPSTTEATSLVAALEDGRLVRGETSVSRADARIRRVFLDPPCVPAPEEALDALTHADLILIGPGSLYTSIIPNLLVPGVSEALAATDALVVYLSNAMTEPGETTGYDLKDHVEALFAHAPGLRLSYVLANREPIDEEALARYKDEGAFPVLANDSSLPCPLVLESLLQKGPSVRHDGVKTARALQNLFHRARLGAGVGRSR
ncbi:MAG TPA: uridine diphosphate-N-acetylglucosamine-binding protein YvcK [Vicinamibacteria bacterium]|nr:uridine diphosphate-N-acetylglucosamine-binding protein YvcK [Vicinamibacteria bacterium]